MKDDNLGIYCVTAKIFFYLETGTLRVHNPIPRLRNTLQQRGLIDFNPQTYMNTNDYQIVTVKQAKINDWEIEPIYISQHIKALVNAKETETSSSTGRGWGKPKETTAKTPAKTPAKTKATRKSKKTEQQDQSE